MDCFAWVQGVTADQLPGGPFALDQARTVTDPAKWLAKIQEDARSGERSPRTKWGSLQHDIEVIHEYVEGKFKW